MSLPSAIGSLKSWTENNQNFLRNAMVGKGPDEGGKQKNTFILGRDAREF